PAQLAVQNQRTGRIMPMRPLSLLIVALAGLVALPVPAQNPPATTPVRVRGAIEKLDGKMLTVKSRDGQTLTITLADNFGVSALVKKTVADIKTIASPRPDSKAPMASSIASNCASFPTRRGVSPKGSFHGMPSLTAP